MSKFWRKPSGGNVSYTGADAINELRANQNLFPAHTSPEKNKERKPSTRSHGGEILKTMGITQSIIDSAAEKTLINGQQKIILELTLQGLSQLQIMEQGHLPDQSGISENLHKAVDQILKNFPNETKLSPEFGKKKSSNPESQQISREFLAEYFQNEDENTVVKPITTNRTLAVFLNHDITIGQIKAAYKKNPHLVLNFAALLLALKNDTLAEIGKRLKYNNVSSLFDSAIIKILKEQKTR